MKSSRTTLHAVREIARGGLGSVELTLRMDGRFERVCAVKRPHPHLLEDESMVDLFLEEGRLAGMLQHPNVVPVLDVGSDARGPYLLMDFVEGIDLAELLKEIHAAGELMPRSIVLQIMAQAAEGLRAAHELVAPDGSKTPLVHRDVSPQNLLIGYDGVVRVVDFGIAKSLTGDRPATTAVLKGKYGYMAPEQLRFEGVDPRTDVFALGVVMFEAFAGRRLYKADSLETVARRVMNEPPPDLSEHRGDTTSELDELLFEMLAKDRNDRLHDMAAVLQRLDVLLEQERSSGDWVSLPSYLDERLGDRRAREQEQRAQEIADARERARDALHMDALQMRADAQPRPRWVMPLSIALSLAAAIGVGAMLSRDSTQDTASVEEKPIAEPHVSVPLQNPPAASGTDLRVEGPTREPGVAELEAAELGAAELGAAESAEATEDEAFTGVKSPMRRRRRARRRAPASSPHGLADQFWE